MPAPVAYAKRPGGSHAVTVPASSLPSPKCLVIVPPSRSSTGAGTNQEVIPGPVATLAHTSSGVPGTSTSRRMARVMSRSLVS